MHEFLAGTLLTLGTGLFISIVTAIFAKACPKEQTYNNKIKPLVINAAKIINSTLCKRLGRPNTEKLEEGILKTTAFWFQSAVNDFFTELLK